MTNRLGAAMLVASALLAQTPDFSGVWKAQKEQSKGLPPGDYLVILEKQGDTLTERTGTYSPRGELRTTASYDLSGKESKGFYKGLPMKSDAKLEGGTLAIASKVAGPGNVSVRRKYTLAPDGNTLTVETVTTMNGQDMPQLIVLARQPNAAGEPLRKPEDLAGARFKNVQLLKDVPASEFMDLMNVFAVSLGAKCSACHVQGDFASDEKKDKAAARHMIKMTNAINQQHFNGKVEVGCYTCHAGKEHPARFPSF